MWLSPVKQLPMDLHKLTDRLRELPEQGISYYQGKHVIRKSYPELLVAIDVMQTRLCDWGVRPGMHVGILAENCFEWILCDLALMRLRCVVVAFPLEEFADVPLDELAERYALNLLLTKGKYLQQRTPSQTWVAPMKEETEFGVQVREICTAAQTDSPKDFVLEPEVWTLVFSSGTSGRPKCLKISKTGTETWLAACEAKYAFKPDDSMIVVLPLSNYQQRLMVYTAIWYGFDLILVEPARFLPALKDLQPTILAGPPAFYEIMENRFQSLPPAKQRFLSTGGQMIRRFTFGLLREKLQRQLFKPFHAAFGSRIRIMLTGGAPSRRSTLDLFDLFGLPLYQVYGLGETGFISLNLAGANRIGSVGKPLLENSITLGEDGEIIVGYKNPLCLGYVGCDEEEERKTFLDSGGIATGDLGRFDDDGFLYITGRKKQVIITQGGYKLQPEPLEQEIEKCPDVSRTVVFGGGELSVIVALVSLGIEDNAVIRERVCAVIEKLNNKLPVACQIGRIVFTTTQFSTDNGLLTRNLKIDRGAIYGKFRDSLLNLS
jgi:long-subunit acyl-CoA synthetase (AMP-forming)